MCFHKWVVDKDTGVYKYSRCTKCDKKRVIQYGIGYQAINRDYVKYGASSFNDAPEIFSKGGSLWKN